MKKFSKKFNKEEIKEKLKKMANTLFVDSFENEEFERILKQMKEEKQTQPKKIEPLIKQDFMNIRNWKDFKRLINKILDTIL